MAAASASNPASAATARRETGGLAWNWRTCGAVGGKIGAGGKGVTPSNGTAAGGGQEALN